MKHVAVIGAGSAGLAAAKACYEGDLQFTVFEAGPAIGGLWYFHEEDIDGRASVMRTTVINSSKEISAFSDFPPPENFPNFMHNRVMHRYLTMYAEKFHLLPHIRFHHKVIQVIKATDYDSTGRWLVTTIQSPDQTVEEEVFDGVMICTGHHGFPYTPNFHGQESFEGRILHSHSVRQPDSFKDQKVLIIGAGNSALDAAVDISYVAKQVYLSTRRGTWILFRLAKNGLPTDTQCVTRYWNFNLSIFGPYLASLVMEKFVDNKFNHELYGLRPKHRFLSQHVTINDHLPNRILSGTVIVKGDVDRFCSNGVYFCGEDEATDVDAVIFATGYKIQYPFMSKDIIPTENNEVNLYKLMFPPDLPYPSLALIGLIQPFGALYPIFELQSRWYVQLLKGKVRLPSKEVMTKDIDNRKKFTARRFVGSLRHTIQVDYISYMDEIASQFGAKPDFWKLAVSDPLLLLQCFFGPCVSYQYRLNGPNQWPLARKTIMTTKQRIVKPLDTRHGKLGSDYINKYFFEFMICMVIILWAFLINFE